jgi:hypothetical protein
MDHRRLSASPPPLHDHRCRKIQRSQVGMEKALGCCLTRDMRAISMSYALRWGLPRRFAPNKKPESLMHYFHRHGRAWSGLVPAIGRGTQPLRMSGTSPAMTVRAGTVRAGFIQGGSDNGRCGTRNDRELLANRDQVGNANRARNACMMAACTSAMEPSAAIITQRSGPAAATSRKPCLTRAWNNASSRS